MSRPIAALLLFAAGCGGSADVGSNDDLNPSASPSAPDSVVEPVPIKMNKAATIPEGFRGDGHPLLSKKDSVEVLAEWTTTGTGRAFVSKYFPAPFYEPFRSLRAAEQKRTYSSTRFSAFMPADGDLDQVGRMWTVDLPKVRNLLQQLDPRVKMQVRSAGRLAGPNGGVAILTASSPTHAEIAFRVHAELDLEAGVFYTPAHFSGSLIVDKQTGTIEYFHLGIPTDSPLNVTLTAVLPTEALIDLVHVERMELRTGEKGSFEWTKNLDPAQADKRLKQAFYKFMDINWVPPEQAVSLAQEQQKPILAIVLWGGLDEQSC